MHHKHLCFSTSFQSCFHFFNIYSAPPSLIVVIACLSLIWVCAQEQVNMCTYMRVQGGPEKCVEHWITFHGPFALVCWNSSTVCTGEWEEADAGRSLVREVVLYSDLLFLFSSVYPRFAFAPFKLSSKTSWTCVLIRLSFAPTCTEPQTYNQQLPCKSLQSLQN